MPRSLSTTGLKPSTSHPHRCSVSPLRVAIVGIPRTLSPSQALPLPHRNPLPLLGDGVGSGGVPCAAGVAVAASRGRQRHGDASRTAARTSARGGRRRGGGGGVSRAVPFQHSIRGFYDSCLRRWGFGVGRTPSPLPLFFSLPNNNWRTPAVRFSSNLKHSSLRHGHLFFSIVDFFRHLDQQLSQASV